MSNDMDSAPKNGTEIMLLMEWPTITVPNSEPYNGAPNGRERYWRLASWFRDKWCDCGSELLHNPIGWLPLPMKKTAQESSK